MRRSTIPTYLLWLAAAAVLSGCRDDSGLSDAQPSNSARDNVARSQVDRGPVRVTVQVEPKEARLSDEPMLTVIIDTENDVKVTKPPFGKSLGDFVIRDFREPLPETSGDRQILRQIYTLEPTRSGKLSIAPIAVTFRDERADGDGMEHTVVTEALTIDVSTVLGDDAPSLAELRPAAGPVELPESAIGTTWWILVGFCAVMSVAAAAWWWFRHKRSAAEPRLSPFELAYLELEVLIERNFSETDVKRFYVEITGIVRRYIERTTGLRAPEQTTDEFFRVVGGQVTVIPPDERERLRQFLESADLVKFAAWQPTKLDIEESFNRAKAFIGFQRQSSSEVAA